MKRNEIDVKDRWATEDLYPSDEAWETAFAEVGKKAEKLAAYAGKLCDSARNMLDFYLQLEDISTQGMRVYTYAMLKSDVDKSDSRYLAFYGRAATMFNNISEKTAFETPELIALDDDVLARYYRELPELEAFSRHIGVERAAKAHTLSKPEETLLASAGEMANQPDDISGIFRDADLRFADATDSEGKKHPITQGTYVFNLESADRTLRKSAFDSAYATYGAFRNTMAGLLNAQVRQLMFFSKARKFTDTREHALFRNEVPSSVYDSLIEAVHANFPAMYKYMALRKKALGVDELHMYDLYTPIIHDDALKMSLPEAKELVIKALAPLGKDYTDVLKVAFENRWIDAYENEGKRGGAYSMGTPAHPYVLLNYKPNIDNVFTLAHEMGHAMHSYLSNKNQRVIYKSYSIFVAEVASTFNESMLMQYLLRTTTDRKTRAALLNYFLEQFRMTLYRQTMFAEFERDINRLAESGEVLTADLLNEKYFALNKLYYGPGVVCDPEIAMEWERIPHFYYDFYVYQYATGYSAAIALSTRVLSEGDKAVADYLGFLSGGCTKDPISLLRGAGVDMASPNPVNDALKLFDRLIGELDEIL